MGYFPPRGTGPYQPDNTVLVLCLRAVGFYSSPKSLEPAHISSPCQSPGKVFYQSPESYIGIMLTGSLRLIRQTLGRDEYSKYNTYNLVEILSNEIYKARAYHISERRSESVFAFRSGTVDLGLFFLKDHIFFVVKRTHMQCCAQLSSAQLDLRTELS